MALLPEYTFEGVLPSVHDLPEKSLRKIAASVANPFPYGADSRELTYVGTTNNVETVVYKRGGVTVKTHTFTYVGNGASDNDKVASETVS